MATAPATEEGSSDLQPANNQLKIPNSVVAADVTIAQLPPSKTSPPPAPFTPLTKQSAKRKRLKPSKFDFPLNNSEKKRSPSKHKALHDPSRKRLKSESQTPVKNSPTMIRAREVQSTLGTDHPTFLKTMLKSHVISCFWMGLPVPFCRLHLPKEETLMVIEDENGQQYKIKYIAYKRGLSGGWRKFAVVHKLAEGDVLVFQLVESTKFKVYIVRVNESKQVDGTTRDLINHNAHKKHKARAKMMYKMPEPPIQRSELKVNSAFNSEADQGGSRKPNLSSQEVETLKDFRIMVNNQCIDLELSEEIRMDYYKLCAARKQLIHDDLREGLYYKLVAGMIGETVNIANAIKNCKPTTTKEEFDAWDSSLKSFELMGMKVGFLRDRVVMLEKLKCESEDAKKYADAKEEKKRNANTIKILEGEIAGLKESNRKMDDILSSLKEKGERYDVVFQEKVNEPW